jgi:hypothetical protein
MPLKFWYEAFYTTAYLINRLPSWVINFISPFQKLFGSAPDYSWLKVFNCACWPHLQPYNTRKLEFHSKRCVFLGYSSSHKGYKCIDVTIGWVYVSWDVVFDENIFPFSQLHPMQVPNFMPRSNSIIQRCTPHSRIMWIITWLMVLTLFLSMLMCRPKSSQIHMQELNLAHNHMRSQLSWPWIWLA